MIYKEKINQYFKKHSTNFPYINNYKVKKESYKYFIIIPIFNEYDYILQTLKSIDKNPQIYLDELLVVLVINNSINDSDDIKNNNFKTHKTISNQKYHYEYLIIDSYSKKNALGKKHCGVGVSRKIGMDFAIYFSRENSILFSLDADTLVSEKYFETITNCFDKMKIKACTINFKHQKAKNLIIEKIIREYEEKLKNIADLIYKSGSPYGYVSMGSALACKTSAYMLVGGMSKKKATEDFYFLQSLAKQTKIYKIKKILIFPSSRDERRVYLGTGYRIKEFKDNQKFINLDYSKEAYYNLNIILTLVDEMWGKDFSVFNKKINKICNQKVINFFEDNNFKDIWVKFCKETDNKNQFILFFNQWFDALKTIKFLKKISSNNKI